MTAAEVAPELDADERAERFTTTRAQRADELRREAVTRALSMLVNGSGPGMASAVLIASVLGSQARIAGIRLPVSEAAR